MTETKVENTEERSPCAPVAEEMPARKKSTRKPWFRMVKGVMRCFVKESKFVYLGDEIAEGGIILSNHEGTSAPLALELYSGLPIRFWGAHEMNDGLFSTYKYQTNVYYREKKHWNIWLARLFCIIASPLTNLFYRGLQLIPTYHDCRLRHTLKESAQALREGNNIVIYPEISDKGYLKELEGFHQGFALLLSYCLRHGIDAPVYVAYYKKDEKTYVVDRPVYISELLADGSSREALAECLCARCNELGKMELPLAV